MALENCSQCGKLFNKTHHDLCLACIEQMERDFETVYHYLKENGPAHIDVIHNETGVDKKMIMKFLAEGRFEGVAVSYKCESCGATITSGKLCDKCVHTINAQIEKMRREEAPQSPSSKQQAYLRQTSLDRYERKK